MGGFARVFGEFIDKAAPRIETALAEKTASLANKAVIENVASFHATANYSKAGKALLERFETNFRPGAEKIESEATQAAAKGNPILSDKGQPLIVPHEIRSYSRNKAREFAFGKKDEGAVFLLNQAKKERGDLHANALADHLGIAWHDSGYSGGGQADSNTLTRNILRHNKNNPDGFIPKDSSPYTAPSKTESRISKFVQAGLAFGAAVPHSASSMLTFLSDGATPYLKAVSSSIPLHNYEGARTFLKATNAIAEMSSLEYNQHFMYDQSKFKKIINDKTPWIKDSVGEILHSNFSMPGMSAVRKWNLTVAGMSAHFHSEEMAARLMHGDEYAENELRRLKLDPDKIRAQGGHLTLEDKRTAVYHGVDYSAFLANSTQRSKFAQAHFMGRMTNTFHTYITRSGKAIAGAIWKEIKNKNPAGIARVLGTLAIIAPEVGNGLQLIEHVAHGKSLGDSYKDWDTEESKLHGEDGFKAFLSSHVNALSHLGSFGIATGLTNAAARSKLLNTLGGPMLSESTEFGQDVVKFFMGTGTGAQIGRDILNDVPSMGIGPRLGHMLFPTRNEVNASKPKTAKQIRAAQTRARHKH